jgi:hypothetical protein
VREQEQEQEKEKEQDSAGNPYKSFNRRKK